LRNLFCTCKLVLSLKKDIVTLKLLICFIRTLINKWVFCRKLPTFEGTCYLHQILKMETAGLCTMLVLISDSTGYHVPEDHRLIQCLVTGERRMPVCGWLRSGKDP